ncbi:hypothetical protein PanWU01x14_153570 [Parasponia andersonii]|uniref:Uncharacterized protein n=1 Tax=Parasponia andersonii TaxID=3476 RepID=A0A2P5CH50_PARAD|nr:hypothetical protein PanWU01x14_153570 [Parasponia andersonii]
MPEKAAAKEPMAPFVRSFLVKLNQILKNIVVLILKNIVLLFPSCSLCSKVSVRNFSGSLKLLSCLMSFSEEICWWLLSGSSEDSLILYIKFGDCQVLFSYTSFYSKKAKVV